MVVVGGAVVVVVVLVLVAVELVAAAELDEVPAAPERSPPVSEHPASRPPATRTTTSPPRTRRLPFPVTARTVRHPAGWGRTSYAAAMTATVRSDQRVVTDLEWGVARGIAGFRWLALTWAAVVLFLTRAQVDGVAVGLTLLLLGLAVTAATTVGSVRRLPWVFHPGAVVVELGVGASMLLLDGYVYVEDHSQSLGSAWPVAGILMAAVAGGPIAGAASGVALGAARWGGAQLAPFTADVSSLSLVSSGVLFAIAGGAAGAAMDRVRRAETAIAQARAREEVARTLHDGVLQTLAVVQRRSADDELVALARDQELDLRAYLAGDRPQTEEIGAAHRSAAARIERRDGIRVEVLFVDDDPPFVAPAVVEAISGAVGEALTNAHKHGQATRATVFVDIDDEVFCSVKDDGQGFDPATAEPGTGIEQSIHARLAEVGGTAEVEARPGSGVEVRLHAPLRPKR